MTDQDKLKALLGEWGVPYSEEDGTFRSPGGEDVPLKAVTVGGAGGGMGVPESPKVDGYCGFYTRFEFGEDGSFRVMGAWE